MRGYNKTNARVVAAGRVTPGWISLIPDRKPSGMGVAHPLSLGFKSKLVIFRANVVTRSSPGTNFRQGWHRGRRGGVFNHCITVGIYLLTLVGGIGIDAARAVLPYRVVEPNLLNEPWRWQSFSNLSGKGVNCLVEGRDGSIWFGVSDGLLRFDGLHWTSYTREEVKLTGPTSYLAAVSNGSIYVGSETELSRFNGESWEPWIAAKPSSDFRIMCVSEASADSLLIGTALGPMWLYRDEAVLFTTPDRRQAAQDLVSGLGLRYTEVKLFPEEIAVELGESCEILSAVMVPGQGDYRTTWLSVRGTSVLRHDESSAEGLNRWKLYRKQDGLSERGKARLVVSQNTVWRIAYGGELSAERFEEATDRWRRAENFESVTHRAGFISLPTQTRDGTIWVGAHRELFALRDGTWTQYDEPQHVIAANDNLLTLATSQGKLWVAGKNQEVYCLDTTNRRWRTIDNLNFQCETSDGAKWFIDKTGAIVSERRDRWQIYESSDGVLQTATSAIPVKQGGVLISGSHAGQMACAWFDGFRWQRKQFADCGVIAEPRALFQAADGTIWIGSHLDEIHSQDFQGWAHITLPASVDNEIEYVHIPPPAGQRELCYGIGQTADGSLWFAGRRLWKLDGDNWNIVEGPPQINASIKDWLQVMPNGSLWVGSRSFGIFQFDGTRWEQVTTENGLLSNRIVSFASAGPNRTWVATDKGFCLFDGQQWVKAVMPEIATMSRETGDLRRTGDGSVWINRFPYKWFEANIYGELSEPSEVAFRTVRYIPDQRAPTTRITLVQDQVAPPGNLMVQWKGADPGQVTDEHQLQYSWRMDSQPWSSYSAETTQVLLSVPSGAHNIEVRARDLDLNVEPTPARASFTVLVPVWRQPWFLATMLCMFAVIGGLLFYLVRLHEQHSVAIERAHAEQAEQVSAARLRFFTNISHEFRTPLTLILGPLEKLLGNEAIAKSSQHRSLLELVKRNAGRLLDLVNQLLDLRKLDAGAMRLQATQADIVEFVKREVESFDHMAIDKNIDLQFESNAVYQLSYFDNDKLRKILSNLISNAIKYTPPCGQVIVQLSLTTEHAEFAISDTGVGIAPQELPLIWDRFYRAQNDRDAAQTGTGVGLALTKELVELHDGSIEVESHLQKGSLFRVRLPMLASTQLCNANSINEEGVSESAFVLSHTSELRNLAKWQSTTAAAVDVDNSEDTLEVESERTHEPQLESERMSLLIVDDNADIRQLLRENFENSYRVLEAEDGTQGLLIASEQIPDLVIADVMMPRLLGTELCLQLKNQMRTNHIPVILLTARSDSDFQLEGLKTGADDYVTKPFSLEHLTARVHNQLESRRALRERLRREFLIEPRRIEVVSPEQEFLQQAMNVVESNLTNSQLGVEMLARELDLSRSHLLRKIKALTDRTTNEFIREVRLKSAARLLAESTLPVADIIHEIGFSDRHHFGRLFRQQFDCNPTQYRQRHLPAGSSQTE